jgi:PKD repeat protein
VNYQVTDGSRTYAGAGGAVVGYTPVTFNGNLQPTIGALPPNGNFNANLERSEFLLFDHTLSNVDREDVEIYLKAKYFGNGTNPAPPAVSFTASPRSGTGSVTAVFSDYSTGSITNRFWNFGDGQTTNTTANTLVHRYTQGGSFTVTLTATGPLGTGTVTRAGYVNVTSLSGIITTNGNYRIETFIRDGIFEASKDTDIEVLLVGGGGGGGGRFGGGGGAGGLVHTNISITAGQYTVRVGPGGQGAPNGNGGEYGCLPGSNSVAFGITAFGGGRGMSGSGASGGGGAAGVAGGVATNGQGYGGGTGGGGGSVYLGGGGGGAGGVGGTALAPGPPGAGGPGLTKAITGASLTYAAGGSGGSWEALTQGSSGAANTGNGGGGSGGTANAGGNGGSGVVIVRYPVGSALLIENRPATGVTTTSAWLNGFLATSTAPARVSVYWGTTDGGVPWSGLWQATNTWPEGAWTSGSSPTYHATSLTPNRFYYYRYYATNASGEAWASTSEGVLVAAPGVNTTTNAGIWNDGAIWSLGRRPVPGDAVTVNHAVLLTNATEVLSAFTITNAAMTFTNWGTALHAGKVTVQDRGTLTLPAAFATNQMSNRVWVVCSDFTIDPGGRILADARGYLTENGPGRGYKHASFWGCGGGGYGGKGGFGQWGGGGITNGSMNAPVDPGSGGGGVEGASMAGGNGGGAVRIEADGKVTVNGTVTANGANAVRPGNMGGGGGAGGGIYITCSSFSGTGILRANGGNGIMGNGAGGGGGGGGRLAVWVGVPPELRTRYLNGEFVREVERTNTWQQFSGTVSVTNGTHSFGSPSDQEPGTACIFSAPRRGMVLTTK